MKILGKLNLNSGKLLSEKDFLNLKGGWGGTFNVDYPGGHFSGSAWGATCKDAEFTCAAYYHTACDCGCAYLDPYNALNLFLKDVEKVYRIQYIFFLLFNRNAKC